MRPRFRRVEVVGVAPMELPGTTKPRVVIDSEGVLWVQKALPAGPFFAELLVGVLGLELRVPIPEMGYATSGFLSRYHQGGHWETMLEHSIVNIDGIGAALALDAIVGNPDRHAQNILLAPTGKMRDDDPELHAWCIDHEGCWLANPMVMTSVLTGDPERSILCRRQPSDLPIERLESAALRAATDASKMSDTGVSWLTTDAAQTAGVDASHRDLAHELLRSRCRAAPRIVQQYIADLRNHSS